MAKSRLGSLLSYLVGIAVVAAAGYAVFYIWQQQDTKLIASRDALAAEVARGPRVQVATVIQGPKERLITLLGDTRPYQVATLYGKVSGYLKSISVDRGDVVKAGQVLAEIESAEIDNQLASALTDLANKRKNAKRAHDLVLSGSKSLQAVDQADTDFQMAMSRVAELTTMKSYELLRAPFDGTVIARFIDPGALVQNAATNQTSSQPVLTIADTSRLRVNVYVEQRDVPFVQVGDMADIADGADQERKTTAKIARTSGQLDPRTRTLYVELELDNTNRFVVPGSFVYVTLHVPLTSYPEIPVAALVTRGPNIFVADVGKDSTVRLRPAKVATTDGIRASLAEGAQPGDRVALNLPDEVGDGSRIRPVETARP